MDARRHSQQIVDQDVADELIDRINPDLAKRFINDAIERFAPTSRQEIWRLRREHMLHLIRVIEHNLDYDLERCAAPNS